MFIIVSLMTLVVAFAGIIVWPGTPDLPNKLFLSEGEIQLARKRLEENGIQAGNDAARGISLKVLKSVFNDWKIYILTIWDIFFWVSCPQGYGGYLLWLKSTHRYSSSRVNLIGASAPGAGIGYVLFVNLSSDLWLGRAGSIVLAHTMNVISMVILVIWDVPDAAKWFAFNIYFFDVGMSSVLYGWANDILRHKKEERAITLVLMNIISTAMKAWVGLVFFKTVEAPQFTKGYSFNLAGSVCIIAFTFVVRYFDQKQE